jgi:hypothetical protein
MFSTRSGNSRWSSNTVIRDGAGADRVKDGSMKRLDQGHLHAELEVLGLTCLGRKSNPGLLGGRRALEKSYSEHLHMSARPVENARESSLVVATEWWILKYVRQKRVCLTHQKGYEYVMILFHKSSTTKVCLIFE